MLRSKVGATSEGMVPVQKEGAVEAVVSTHDLVSMMKTMMNGMKQMNNCMESFVIKVNHLSGKAGVEEDIFGERSQPAAEDGEIRNTPYNGTHTLPPRPHEEQQSTGHQEEE